MLLLYTFRLDFFFSDQCYMLFQFEHIGLDQIPGKEKWDLAPLDFRKLKEVLAKWQKALYGCGWNSLFWNNHDLPRIVSRWGNDGKYRVESAKMLAALLHGLQGTPYIYQGEELGMTNAGMEDIADYRDIESLNMHKERLEAGYSEKDIMASLKAKSRDNARTPMQWDDSENAGFTTGTPWLKVNPNYKQINAASQVNDPDSVFSFYRRLVELRNEYDVFVDGAFELLYEDDPDIFAYTRTTPEETLTVLCNFHDGEAALSEKSGEKIRESGLGELLISNYKDVDETKLRPYEARMYLKKTV